MVDDGRRALRRRWMLRRAFSLLPILAGLGAALAAGGGVAPRDPNATKHTLDRLHSWLGPGITWPLSTDDLVNSSSRAMGILVVVWFFYGLVFTLWVVRSSRVRFGQLTWPIAIRLIAINVGLCACIASTFWLSPYISDVLKRLDTDDAGVPVLSSAERRSLPLMAR